MLSIHDALLYKVRKNLADSLQTYEKRAMSDWDKGNIEMIVCLTMPLYWTAMRALRRVGVPLELALEVLRDLRPSPGIDFLLEARRKA